MSDERVCDTSSGQESCDRVQGLPVGVVSGPERNPLPDLATRAEIGGLIPGIATYKDVLIQKERELAIQEKTAVALTQIASFLSGTTLPQVLQTIAVNGAAQSLLGGLTANAGRQGLDARTMKQNAIDIAYLIEQVFKKLSSHAQSRGGIKDGEELMGVKDGDNRS